MAPKHRENLVELVSPDNDHHVVHTTTSTTLSSMAKSQGNNSNSSNKHNMTAIASISAQKNRSDDDDVVDNDDDKQKEENSSNRSSVIDKLSSYLAVVLSIVLAIYYIGYQEEAFLNHFNFVTRFVWLVALIISATYQDTIHTTTRKLITPTTIEYHTQTIILSGYLAYSIAGCILASTYQIPLLSRNSRTMTMTIIVDAITSKLSFLESYENKSKLFYALGIIGSYHGFQNLFSSVWIESTKPRKPIQRSTLEVMEYNLAVPLCLLGMLLFQQDHIPLSNQPQIDTWMTLISQDYYDYAVSCVYGWIVLKMIRLAFAYRSNSQLRTITFPNPEGYTPYLLKKKHEGVTELVDVDDDKTDRQPNDERNIWRIYGNEYDMNEFVTKHPGGIEAIMLGANRDDCTPLFQSYHPFNINKAKQVLQKYRISNETNEDNMDQLKKKEMTSITNKNIPVKDKNKRAMSGVQHENDLFYDVLCQRVAECLRKANIDPIKDRGAPFARVLSYTFLISITIAAGIAHFYGYILGSICLGSFGVCLGGHMGHDGGHFAVSRIPLINDLSVWCISIICNPVIWQHQHTYGHHSFTNNKEQDPDLHHFRGLMRLWENEDSIDRVPFVKNKGSFGYIMYIFAHSTFSENHLFPVMFTLDRSLHGIVEWTDRKRLLRTMSFFLHFTLYMCIMLAPFFVNNPLHALGNLVGFLFASGLQFSFCSQVGHITEFTLDDERIEANKAKRNEIAKNSWAADQIERSNDFCPHDWMWFGIAGGLNLQIEHHLFPGLNHWHLTLIQPIVEETCKEYGIDYKSYGTFRELFHETIKYLQKHARTGDE